MNTHRFADVSTAHLPANERELLDVVNTVRVIPHDYGCWVNVPLDDLHDRLNILADHEFPVLASLIERAANHGCWWINFDRDAETHDDLTIYEE